MRLKSHFLCSRLRLRNHLGWNIKSFMIFTPKNNVCCTLSAASHGKLAQKSRTREEAGNWFSCSSGRNATSSSSWRLAEFERYGKLFSIFAVANIFSFCTSFFQTFFREFHFDWRPRNSFACLYIELKFIIFVFFFFWPYRNRPDTNVISQIVQKNIRLVAVCMCVVSRLHCYSRKSLNKFFLTWFGEIQNVTWDCGKFINKVNYLDHSN